MNHNLTQLQPYPFAKMAKLLANSTPPPDLQPIKLSIGEPAHPTPTWLLDVLRENLDKIQNYPSSKGLPALRGAITDWLTKRFALSAVDAETQVLPVCGTREGLFSLTQAIVDINQKSPPYVIMPNPFYQIYEGATLLAGAQPYFVACDASNHFCGDYERVPSAVWQRTQLVFVCSPNNPTGAVMSAQQWQHLIELSDRYGFVIVSDECYSELYFDAPPLGLLQVCAQLGRHDYRNCLVMHSLSKRSNAPGLRSGFVAGDARVLQAYAQYRTYHGCAMGLPQQYASIAAWQDETHVVDNRQRYQQKFALWLTQLGDTLALRQPDAGFYLWVAVPAAYQNDDEAFVKALYERCAIHALAGRYLSRTVAGHSPGSGFVRLALVADMAQNQTAITRLRALLTTH